MLNKLQKKEASALDDYNYRAAQFDNHDKIVLSLIKLFSPRWLKLQNNSSKINIRTSWYKCRWTILKENLKG